MARRYSNREKEKWAADPSHPPKRAPIVLPEVDSSRLIDEHRFTLIGRVTNPAMQNTRALVDFFLQHWQVMAPFTGRALGPLLFQFTFASEQDLRLVLSKGPYHFKRWMCILQRWEPIVSDSFPANLQFWVTVHGLPLHLWTDAALYAIGKELGPVETTDEVKGRIRVTINGLKPLEKFLEISLKSGGTKQVELEYEKLEKHCFSCLSLSHEAGSCPNKDTITDSSSSRVGITQQRTLDRIAEGRRRADNRKLSRFSPYGNHGEQHTRRMDHHSRENLHQRNDSYHRGTSDREDRRNDRSYSSSEDRGRERSRNQTTNFLPPIRENPPVSLRSREMHYTNPTSKSYWRPVEGDGIGNGSGRESHFVQSQVSHTPSPKTQREPMGTGRRLQLNSPHTPGANSGPSGERRSALERISGEPDRIPPLHNGTTNSGLSGESRSALERLSGEPDRVPLLHNGVANSDSGRLQEVNIQYLEDALPYQTPPEHMIPSSSKAIVAGNVELQAEGEGSPIRTLSEDRAHVSLRLGPLPPSPSPPPPVLSSAKTKAAGKQKATRAPPKKKVQKSPAKGLSLSKRRVTKTQSSPKRRTVADAKAKGKAPATGARPSTTLIPAISKKRADFRAAPPSLP